MGLEGLQQVSLEYQSETSCRQLESFAADIHLTAPLVRPHAAALSVNAADVIS